MILISQHDKIIDKLYGEISMKENKTGNNYKQKIYDAALQLFYQNGYADTSVADIISLSGTNKGSFYHYYKSKSALAEEVFLNAHYQHVEMRDIFPEEDSLVLLALENLINWYAKYNNTYYMRFLYDLNVENMQFETRHIYDPCFSHTSKKFTREEFALIVSTNQGIRRSLYIFIIDKMDQYSYDQLSSFYLTTLFKLFDIPQSVIKSTLTRSKELIELVDIKLEEFSIFVSKKKNDD